MYLHFTVYTLTCARKSSFGSHATRQVMPRWPLEAAGHAGCGWLSAPPPRATSAGAKYIYIYIHMHIRFGLSSSIYIYMCMCMYIYIHTPLSHYVYEYVLHMCMYIYTHMCGYFFIYIHLCIYKLPVCTL